MYSKFQLSSLKTRLGFRSLPSEFSLSSKKKNVNLICNGHTLRMRMTWTSSPHGSLQVFYDLFSTCMGTLEKLTGGIAIFIKKNPANWEVKIAFNSFLVIISKHFLWLIVVSHGGLVVYQSWPKKKNPLYPKFAPKSMRNIKIGKNKVYSIPIKCPILESKYRILYLKSPCIPHTKTLTDRAWLNRVL